MFITILATLIFVFTSALCFLRWWLNDEICAHGEENDEYCRIDDDLRREGK